MVSGKTKAQVEGVPSNEMEEGQVIWSMRDIVGEMPPMLRQAFSRDNMNQPQLNQLEIQAAIKAWQRFPGDTGSPEVQIAVMTQKLKIMATHIEKHKKDTYTKRRLILGVHARNRMLKYLRRVDRAKFHEVLEAFAIRPNRAFDPTLPRRPTKPGESLRKLKGVRALKKQQKAKGGVMKGY